jgi:flagellar basal-body rod protein FlgC
MPEISIMPSIGISASGLDAESRRMEIIANNVANAQTTRGPDGKVYHRQEAVFATQLSKAVHDQGVGKRLGGVQIQKVVVDDRPLPRDYRPGHPDADENGYVTMPNVNTLEEMVDMMSSSRAYEANLAAGRTAKNMAMQAIEILK